MEPVTMAVLAGGAAQILAAADANKKQAKSEAEARKIMRQAMAEIQKISPPDPEGQKAFFEELKRTGSYTPELEQAVQMGPSNWEGVKSDPQMKQAQLDALARLETVGAEGLDSQDKLALTQIQNRNQQAERGSREALMQGMQRRGMGGSGAELAAQLSSQQGSADRQSMEGMQVASMAQQRALDAMMQRGSLAGQMRGQDFGEQASKADALDRIKQFNTTLRADQGNRNTDRINAGSQYNLGENQRIADSNVGIRNDQQMQHKGVNQTHYNNQLNKAGMTSNAASGQANQAIQSGNRQADFSNRVGQAAGMAGASWADYEAKKKKEGQI